MGKAKEGLFESKASNSPTDNSGGTTIVNLNLVQDS
jgi:hypothetical protein